MAKKPVTIQTQPASQNEDLRARLIEAEETLRAIRSGEVDALIVPVKGGEQLFTLKGADHSYRMLIEEMSEGALTLSAEGVILYANRHFGEMLKTPLEKVIGSTIHALIAPDSGRILESLLRKGVDIKRRGQLALIAGDGTLIPVYLSVSNLPTDGTPDSFGLVATDLTEQKQHSDAIVASEKMVRELLTASEESRLALLSMMEDQKRTEEALKESEEKFRFVFDNSSIGKSITSIDGTVHVNPAFCEMLGYTMEELAHRNWRNFTHPDDNEMTQKLLEELLSGEKSNIRCRKRYIKKDGSIVWADVSTVLQKDKDNKPLYYITAVVDITERKKVEEALLESERKLTEAQKMAQLGHWDWDIKTGKVVWSDEVYKIFRIDQKNFTPHIDSILELSPWPEDHERDKELIRKAMESHEKGSYEQRFLRPDKTIGYYDSTFQGKYDSHGNLVSIVGTVQDITERKRLEEKLHQYTMQLEQKSRDLEQIIYVTSHDLRSPLVNVQGFAKELARSIMELMEAIHTGDISAEAMRKIGPILKKDIPESLEYIQSSITQMDMQLSALLKLSRLGRAAINVEQLDMNRTVSEILKTLEFVAKEKGVKIEVEELPPCMADAAQTNQIFLNLIGNALKYLDAKRPGIIQVRGNTQENRVIYCIEDNGVGIARGYQEKIFEIFYRVEQHKCPGEGLGLTIVRQSAEKQNGAVWVESEAGKGSRFFVKLPGI